MIEEERDQERRMERRSETVAAGEKKKVRENNRNVGGERDVRKDVQNLLRFINVWKMSRFVKVPFHVLTFKRYDRKLCKRSLFSVQQMGQLRKAGQTLRFLARF